MKKRSRKFLYENMKVLFEKSKTVLIVYGKLKTAITRKKELFVRSNKKRRMAIQRKI